MARPSRFAHTSQRGTRRDFAEPIEDEIQAARGWCPVAFRYHEIRAVSRDVVVGSIAPRIEVKLEQAARPARRELSARCHSHHHHLIVTAIEQLTSVP